MNSGGNKRYNSHLRQTQVELTQRTIMEAMASVLIEHGPAGDAVKEVAKRANVSERTIYRHFPSKEALWDAFLLWVSDRVGLDHYPETADQMLETVPGLFAQFDENEELLRSCLDIRAWSDVWLRGRSGWKEGIDKLLTNSFKGLPAEARDKAGSVIHLLFNGINWKTMKDQWGFSGPQAAVATQWALIALFEDLEREVGQQGEDRRIKASGKVQPERRMVEGREVKGSHYSTHRTPQSADLKSRKPRV